MDFEEMFVKTNESYLIRKRKYEESEKIIWENFDKEVKELTDIVHKDFRKVLDDIGPVIAKWACATTSKRGANILEFKVNYLPHYKKFIIEIEKIKNLEGHVIGGENNKDCPHIYLEPITGMGNDLDPRIEDFKERYYIRLIGNPRNNCEHK